MARCELHGTVTKRGEKQYMTAYALNEWDSKMSAGIEWRQKIDQQVRVWVFGSVCFQLLLRRPTR